jgi:hypothetical protein
MTLLASVLAMCLGATALAPALSPAAGTYASAQTVTVKPLSSGSVIRCTTDGSTPSLASSRYLAPLSVAATTTVKCAAWVKGKRMSAVATAAYVISSGRWQPTADAHVAWNWNITETGVAAYTTVAMYDVDLFSESQAWIATLKARGHKVICYFSAGSSENFRPDFSSFPTAVMGNNNGWAGEKWLDVRASSGALAIIQPIMAARLDLAVSKGCDGVEPDNVDGFDNNTGFPITAADQLVYNKWTADQAHARGLSVGLKNDVGQLADLVAWYDWALNEECGAYQECGGYSVFQAANKAVFHTEYTTQTVPSQAQLQTRANTVCGWAVARRPAYFNTIIKGLDLPDLMITCP